ncbi:hypothetical protein EC973_002162 [Apophysomyces ossiformis]|uniref:Uncharacterized protein n=1 Tax=Apophysomyces ossiformis TaxID=679940 RepID=A0A8H7BIN9_9FUNG|nr:hypothetical protein EC973_002162 [Apophysomyces ossiformis]
MLNTEKTTIMLDAMMLCPGILLSFIRKAMSLLWSYVCGPWKYLWAAFEIFSPFLLFILGAASCGLVVGGFAGFTAEAISAILITPKEKEEEEGREQIKHLDTEEEELEQQLTALIEQSIAPSSLSPSSPPPSSSSSSSSSVPPPAIIKKERKPISTRRHKSRYIQVVQNRSRTIASNHDSDWTDEDDDNKN